MKIEDDCQEETNVRDISLLNFCAVLDQANISSRYGALLATALLRDLNMPNIIRKRHKIDNERYNSRKVSVNSNKCIEVLEGISFDGKREKCLEQIEVNGKLRNINTIKEHITVVKEPNSIFIGYFSPNNGKGTTLANGIIDFLNEQTISINQLVAVNCDGTRTNTGKNNGALCKLEEHLQRPLQWLVCLFHFNELPFTALLKALLGNASGPQNWPGIIGKTLPICETIPVSSIYISKYIKLLFDFYKVVQNFEAIKMGEMPENINDWEIRDDQKYLYDMVKAVDSGHCNEHLSSIKPGRLNLSRWLTTASRILRLYVTQTEASKELKTLTFFIMKIYAPFWFLIKNNPYAIHGSRYIFKYIEWTRELPNEIQVVIESSIQINAFFAHPENIILSMITDDKREIRNKG